MKKRERKQGKIGGGELIEGGFGFGCAREASISIEILGRMKNTPKTIIPLLNSGATNNYVTSSFVKRFGQPGHTETDIHRVIIRHFSVKLVG